MSSPVAGAEYLSTHFEDLVYGSVIVLSLSALLLAAHRALRRPQKADLPVFPAEHDVVKTLEHAHEQYPDTPFVLSMAGMEVVVLPVAEIEHIKSLPETELSIKRHHYNVFLGEYTYMGTKADEFDSAMRHILTRNTPVVLDSFTAEVEYAINSCIGECGDDWKPIRVRATMSRVASLMSGRAFVGLPLSRDPEWVEATTNYTQDVSRAWMALKMLPWYKRPLLAWSLPQVQSLKHQKQINVEKLGPLLAQKQAKGGSEKSSYSEIPGGDMIDWFISRYEKSPTAQDLARDQLLATFASIYNLSNALSYIVFDLAANPDCIDELRQEILDVVGEGGVIDKIALPKLRKLDSFARESQRLNPPSLVNIPRVVTNPHGFQTLSGHKVPFGYTVMVRAHPINMSPSLYPSPEKFDPFRFSNLRQQPGNEMKFQHSSTGVDNINFGHGIWACPGRFFAAAQIKVVMAYLIMNFDLMVKPGEGKPGQVHYGLATLPNAEADILFRKRKGGSK